jgi:hypothetical protein
MPTVAIVDGVQIRFYPREHPPPHFHAILAEYRARIEIQPLRVLNSNFPPAKLAAVLSWAQPRTRALLDTWYVVASKKKPEKIR